MQPCDNISVFSHADIKSFFFLALLADLYKCIKLVETGSVRQMRRDSRRVPQEVPQPFPLLGSLPIRYGDGGVGGEREQLHRDDT